MKNGYSLGIDCGSVSLNLALVDHDRRVLETVYIRTQGRPLFALIDAGKRLSEKHEKKITIEGAIVTGSAREMISKHTGIPAVNEIKAHAQGSYWANKDIRTIIEIGGQDSKFIQIGPSDKSAYPKIVSFRMNEICAAGAGAFLDEQAARLNIEVERFGEIASQSNDPAIIAARCAVFAKTDMIHRAQEGAGLPDILLGAAYSLARNFIANLVRGSEIKPIVSLQGGVMANSAVARAFRDLLGIETDQIIIPQHYNILGAIGAGLLGLDKTNANPFTLDEFINSAQEASKRPNKPSTKPRLRRPSVKSPDLEANQAEAEITSGSLVLGLDIGSVSSKGVLIDNSKRIIRSDYRLTDGKPLDSIAHTIAHLTAGIEKLDFVSITGSGRYLAAALLDADMVVNEISAQTRAAVEQDPDVECIVEIGGQDSKWIRIDQGLMADFAMNRVCAAGTGSFLMEQASRLSIEMGPEFSEKAFSSNAPADLGNRCTVFMESDLVHHQNNGAQRADLAAGVCLSIVRNYLDRVVPGKDLSGKVMFLGGVAANDAVRSAFEAEVKTEIYSPWIYRVSAAYGAALKALDQLAAADPKSSGKPPPYFAPEKLQRETFRCTGCNNRCSVDKYRTNRDRIVFHGGSCDRWEKEVAAKNKPRVENNLFMMRSELLEKYGQKSGGEASAKKWGMVRSPLFYEWFPFWSRFLKELGVDLQLPENFHRDQYDSGLHRLKVESCLPMKALAGQLEDLMGMGIKEIFHPTIISETLEGMDWRPIEQCPYTLASSEFLKGDEDINWIEPVICHEPYGSEAFKEDHIQWAMGLGHSRAQCEKAYKKGMASREAFELELRSSSKQIIDSLEQAGDLIVVLGKPYHLCEPFFNMNIASIFRRLGVNAIPGDLLPIPGLPSRSPIPWKNQLQMIAAAREVGVRPNLYPVLISFFGCGPDPFTIKHIQSAAKGKPLLILEMDEHSSKAGVMTRVEAFLDRVAQFKQRNKQSISQEKKPKKSRSQVSSKGLDSVYIPYFGEHSHILAATARSMGINAEVLPEPDDESSELGRAHLVGGECHPYALMLGDYLKLNKHLKEDQAARSLYAIPGFSACRLGQYPIYTEKIRKELGLPMRVITDLSQSAKSAGLPTSVRDMILMRMWEGLNAFDILLSAYYSIRPYIVDHLQAKEQYEKARDSIIINLAMGNTAKGVEEALDKLAALEVKKNSEKRPTIAITGDYYTRIVPYSNNRVFDEIESLGAVILPPPTFTDGVRYFYMKQALAPKLQGASQNDNSAFYAQAVLAEAAIKAEAGKRFPVHEHDPFSSRTLRRVSTYYDTRMPAGIAAPLATLIGQLNTGIDGVLNLITLNCSYGTVVTATLTRALANCKNTPMLTLIYDGQKKTNERTRLEAFMDQAWDQMSKRL